MNIVEAKTVADRTAILRRMEPDESYCPRCNTKTIDIPNRLCVKPDNNKSNTPPTDIYQWLYDTSVDKRVELAEENYELKKKIAELNKLMEQLNT